MIYICIESAEVGHDGYETPAGRCAACYIYLSLFFLMLLFVIW